MSKLRRSADAKGDWDTLNASELAALAQDIDPNAHRGCSREVLLSVLRGESPPLPTYRPDKYRLRIMQYLDENWERVEPLLTCPARSRDPHACFACTDVQVAECSLSNAVIFKKETK